MKDKVFVNRRSGKDRREGVDQRQNPRLDLAHRRRRKGDDRRQSDNLLDDYTALIGEKALETQKGTNITPH